MVVRLADGVAIKAIFVGINKHIDTTIPEFGGARRDATALWALFTDTVDGLSARLLVDETATHAEVSRAMLGTLAEHPWKLIGTLYDIEREINDLSPDRRIQIRRLKARPAADLLYA